VSLSPDRSPARPARDRARLLLRDGLLPFRAATPLAPAIRLQVAARWAVLGGIIAAIWSVALALAFARAWQVATLLLIVALVVGGAAFFGALGYLMVGIGNRLLAGQSAPPRGTPGAGDPPRA
jgi:hypothetical protein